jgi:hypothetical protein
MSTNLIVRLAALSNIDVNDLTIFARRLVQSVRITDIYFNLYLFLLFVYFCTPSCPVRADYCKR